jgi:SAM-dependent methyltransferase
MRDDAGRTESAGAADAYDRIAGVYDPWSRSVVEDVAFYVAEARKAAGRTPGAPAAGPVVELGVGTGRIAVPIALAGVPVIGVDTSAGMLAVCRTRAEEAGVADLLDLRVGDFRTPPVSERVPLVICPFRAYLHLPDDDRERLAALETARELLLPGGLLAFDVFTPSPEDVEETHGQWLEREPGIWERALERGRAVSRSTYEGPKPRRSSARRGCPSANGKACLERAGFEVEACMGWFDRRSYDGGEDRPASPVARHEGR